MDLPRQLEHYRKEHDEILRFLREFDETLTLASDEAEETRRLGLARLRGMEETLAGIREHCRAEEQNVESPFQIYLDDYALEDLHVEHLSLEKHSHDFCAELVAVTAPPPTEDLVRLGWQLVDELRRHIAREGGLLKQVADGRTAEEKIFLRYTQPGE